MPKKEAPTPRAAKRAKPLVRKPELVIITGISGSGKGSVLRAL
jgi:hypothetical protein